ncbi:M28 family peptidase [Sphingomonas sp.]|uniref:M28 family peptidase n=1 Tax=Sphingomonas sp. TaxID=28214 RepID=UPI002ED88A76
MTVNLTRRERLLEILSWARPHDSEIERRFAREFLDSVPGMQADAFGNRWIDAGEAAPHVMWSCHIDTVAAKGQCQMLAFDSDSGVVSLAKGKPGMSLGADDGVGVWMMLEMLKAGRPGRYVFHRGEEVGCLGSRHIADKEPQILDGIQIAIALDRAGERDIITHQLGARTASDEFAASFAAQVNARGFLDMRADDGGVYTDTNEYAGVVPECTNISVGYHGQHGPRETLSVYFAEALLDELMRLDVNALVVARDPAEIEDDYWQQWEPRRTQRRGEYHGMEDMLDAIVEFPEVAREMLLDLGITPRDFEDAVWDALDRDRDGDDRRASERDERKLSLMD